MDTDRRLKQFQNTIGYRFADPALLETALRHSSFLNEHGLRYTACNERLEFLGDAVLELVCSTMLYRLYPEKPEGELTRMRAALVCEGALAEKARTLGLGELLELGRGEEKTGGRQKDSLLSDAAEALIGAVYLDGGLEKTEAFIRRYILCEARDPAAFADHKTALQEFLQAEGTDRAVYETVPCKDGDRNGFFSKVLLKEQVLGAGFGNSKKAAEQEAAGQAMRALTAPRTDGSRQGN